MGFNSFVCGMSQKRVLRALVGARGVDWVTLVCGRGLKSTFPLVVCP